MNLEQFDFIIRYDDTVGMVLPDKASMDYANTMVKTERFDITVGSEFLLTAFRYALKQNRIDASRIVFVVPALLNGEEVKTTVLVEKTYNLDYGIEGRFDYPNYMTRMLMDLF